MLIINRIITINSQSMGKNMSLDNAMVRRDMMEMEVEVIARVAIRN